MSTPAPPRALGLAQATHSARPSSAPIDVNSVNSVRGYFSPTATASAATAPAEKTKEAKENKMEHIDRKELYTSLGARIHYLHSFLDFNPDDVNALILGSKYIKSLIPAVVNIVYKKLLRYDITARAFTTRSTSYSGPVDEILSEDSPQIRYRKMFLRGYLQKLCSDPSKYEFWEYLDKVGMMHVGQGRKHPLHVEYVHIGACLGFIQDVVVEAILAHPRLRLEQKTAVVKALGKVLWIQNDLFAKWYVRDGEEFRDDQEEVEVEQEGYLHGKKVLAEDPGEDEAADEGGCPFKGMAGGPNPHIVHNGDAEQSPAGPIPHVAATSSIPVRAGKPLGKLAEESP